VEYDLASWPYPTRSSTRIPFESSPSTGWLLENKRIFSAPGSPMLGNFIRAFLALAKVALRAVFRFPSNS